MAPSLEPLPHSPQRNHSDVWQAALCPLCQRFYREEERLFHIVFGEKPVYDDLSLVRRLVWRA